jgi:hypothetical protein
VETQGRPSIRFILNGHRYELVREDVEQRLADVAPDAIRKHAVRVNGIWFPVIQAFEVATGIPRSEFMSNTARRHLAALGYEVTGEVEPRAGLPAARAAFTPAGVPSRDLEDHTPEGSATGELEQGHRPRPSPVAGVPRRHRRTARTCHDDQRRAGSGSGRGHTNGGGFGGPRRRVPGNCLPILHQPARATGRYLSK